MAVEKIDDRFGLGIWELRSGGDFESGKQSGGGAWRLGQLVTFLPTFRQ